MRGLARVAITSDGSTPALGNAATVMVRNWLRRRIFSVSIPYVTLRHLAERHALRTLQSSRRTGSGCRRAARAPRRAGARRSGSAGRPREASSTGMPFMPAADDSATSRFDTPAKLARSASTSQLDLEAVGAPVVAHAVGARDRPQDRLRVFSASRRSSAMSVTRQPDRHGNADRLARFELPHVDAGARDARGQRALQRLAPAAGCRACPRP